jgi:protein SCO1/2
MKHTLPRKIADRQPSDWALLLSALLVTTGWAGSTAIAIGPPPKLPVSRAPDDGDKLQPEQEGVTIEQNLGDMLPLDLTFTDSAGQVVALGDYFKAGKPVVLQLGYYRCPMLCDLVMRGMVDASKKLSWLPGEEYEIITLSIDPAESSDLARQTKGTMIELMGRPEAAEGWHFLVGDQENITQLSQTVGISFKWIPKWQQWSHPAAIVVISPEGEISRYLFGTNYVPQTLRLSMVEAAEGKVGSFLDHALVYCLRFDPSTGQYTYAVMNIMRAGGTLTIIVIVAIIITLLVRESRRRKAAETAFAHHA